MKFKKLMAVTLCATMALPVVAFAKPNNMSIESADEAVEKLYKVLL